MQNSDRPVGILMLDSRFPRIPGDMGSAATWPFPVLIRTVAEASPERVVRNRAEGLLPAFISTAQELVAEGACAITTTCGFLSLFQREIAAAVPVPVATSALMQVPLANALLPNGKVAGVLTISASSLSEEHLLAAGAPAVTPVGSTEGGQEFSRVILGDESKLDIEAARADLVDAANALQAAHPTLGAIVLECTNMTPYAADVERATGLPVWSMVSLVTWLRAGALTPVYPST